MELIPGYKQTDLGVVPEDWQIVSVDSVLSEISMGPFGSDIKVSNFISEGVPVLNGSNIRRERLSEDFVNFVSYKKARSLKKAVAHRGDIVVTHRGTLGQIAYIPDGSTYDQYVISQSQFRARFAKGLVHPAWIVLYFRSSAGAEKLLEGKGHTGVPAIAQPTKAFRRLRVPVPPLPEQALVSGALSDADALIESLEQLLAKKRQIKRGVMQELLTGKERLPGFGEPWKEVSVGDVISRHFCGPSPTCEERNILNEEWGVLKTTAITWEKGWDWTKHKALPVTYWNQPHLEVRKGDVVVTKAGPRHRVGVTAWVDECPRRIIVSGKMIALRPNPSKAVSLLLASAIAAPEAQVFLDQRTTGMAESQVNFENAALLGTPILLPEIDEQKAIAAIVSDVDAELAAVEAKLTKARQLKQGMMQELLTGRIRLV